MTNTVRASDIATPVRVPKAAELVAAQLRSQIVRGELEEGEVAVQHALRPLPVAEQIEREHEGGDEISEHLHRLRRVAEQVALDPGEGLLEAGVLHGWATLRRGLRVPPVFDVSAVRTARSGYSAPGGMEET